MEARKVLHLPADQNVNYSVRRCTEADLDLVEEIERLSFPAPWARAAFADELERPWAHLELLCQGPSGHIVGFCNYWVVADELHILNVAVRPEERRRGHARRLLGHMLEAGRQARVRVLSLEVRASNTAAVALYRRLGFRQVGLRPKYYADNGEDALLMDLELLPA
jgi:[ribosomal protein S18]-alanine N-acetyltransferase